MDDSGGKLIKNEKVRAWINQLCLFDDIFFNAAFADNKECTQLVLRIILGMDDLTVISVKTQDSIKNIYGRSVRLDVLAEDSTGKIYNIEVQRGDSGASAKRARYNSSLMDASITEPGEDLAGLVETFVIFITENDVIGDGMALYHIDRQIKETGRYFGDGAHIIYVNGSDESDTDLGRLMHDFRCRVPEEMYYGSLAETSKQIKSSEGGTRKMDAFLEEILNETKQEAEKERSREIARCLITFGNDSLEEIAKATHLSLEEVQMLAQEQSA